jgi:hypothetical protein
MYEGYLELGGVEIANVERVQKYVRNTQCGIPLHQFDEHDGLYLALGQQDYVSPVADNAPWYDANMPDSADFLGLYPLGMNNVSDSTRQAPVTESVRAGGTIGAGRAATREMRVTGFLVGRTRVGAEMGLAWLRAIAEEASCTTTSTAASTAGDMRYFLDHPVVESALRVERHHYRTKIVAGPSVISERAFQGGGYTITVELIITAEIPAAFTRPSAPDLSTETTSYAWAGAVNGSISTRSVDGAVRGTNYIANPSAEGTYLSLAADVAAAVDIIADAGTGPGARAFRSTSSTAELTQARATDRPTSNAGQRWWARARARLGAAMYGARKVSAKVVFRDVNGGVISWSQAARPAGITHRWLGAPYNSPSERIEGASVRTNLLPDPYGATSRWRNRWFGGGVGAGNYTPMSGAGIADADAPDQFLRKAWTANANTNGDTGFEAEGAGFSVKPGQVYTASAWMRASVDKQVGTRFVFLDSSNAQVLDTFVTLVNLSAGAWSLVSGTITVPAGAVRLYPIFDVTGAFSPWQAGQFLDIAGAQLEAATTRGPFFGGATHSTTTAQLDQKTVNLLPTGVFHRWLGGASASKSERYEGTRRRVNDIIDPLFTNSNAWYKNPSATYDFTQPGVVKVAVGSAIANGGLVIYTASAMAPGEAGSPKSASYLVTNTSTAPFTLYGNIRAYGANSSIDSPTSADQVINPGETAVFTLPAVTPLATTEQGYRALMRTRGLAAGQTLTISEAMGESVSTPQSVPGPFFSGASASTGTGRAEGVVDFAIGADAPVGTATVDVLFYRDPAFQAAAGDIELFDSIMLTQSSAAEAPAYYDGSSPTTYRFGQPGGSATAVPTTSVADQPDVLWNYNADPLYLGFSFTDPLPVVPRSTANIATSREFDNTSGIEGRPFINYSRMTATAAGTVRNGWTFTTIEKAFVPTSITVAAWVRSNKAVTLTLRYFVSGGSDLVFGNFQIPANTWTKIAAPMSISALMANGFTFYLEMNSNLASGDTLDLALPRQSNVFDANVPLVAGSMTNDPELYEYGYAIRRGPANSQSYGSYRRPTQRYSAAALTGRVRAPELDPTNRVSVVNLPSNDRWRRTYLSLDSQVVPKWADLIPIISVTSAADTFQSQTALSGLRIRFWPNPLRLSPAAATADQTKYESELVIARLPASTKIVLDGISRRSSASIEGREELSANHLVFDSKGRPINWPALDCATPYIVTIDYPATSANTALYTVAALEILTSRRER